jgi:transposase InsO family protein
MRSSHSLLVALALLALPGAARAQVSMSLDVTYGGCFIVSGPLSLGLSSPHAGPDLGNLIHQSDRGVQYVSIRYTERFAEAGIEPSVGSVGDSYDNALAETIFSLYKAEVIRPNGPWRSLEEVESATLEWVDWFNNLRLLQPLGDIRPAEFEELHYARQESPTTGVGLN